jgi:hypothetical protein
MNDWSAFEMTAILTGFLGLLAFLGWLAETVGPDPWKEPVERRR